MTLARHWLRAVIVASLASMAAAANAAANCDLGPDIRRIHVRDFQAKGDGKTDDGPALRAALREAAKSGRPAAVILDKGKTYRISSFENKYALRIGGATRIQLIGNGSLLSLEPPNRVLELKDSADISLCDFTLDYSPLPFTQGTVVAVDGERSFDVQIEGGFGMPPPPALQGDFGSKGWEFAIPLTASGEFDRRVNIRAITPVGNANTVRVDIAASARPGVLRVGTRIVLPMPGSGQTGNFTFQIVRNKGVHVQDVTIHAVPQGTFYVADNTGEVTFLRVAQKPPANTRRMITGWRGIFHAKDNRAAVKWDHNFLSGAFDDAININTMYQLVVGSDGKGRWVIRDLGLDAATVFREGDKIRAISLDPQRREVGLATVTSVVGQADGSQVIATNPPLSLVPAGPDCAKVRATCGMRIINLSTANPGSSISNTRVIGSVRLRGSATVNRSEIDGVLQITSSPTREGPSPENIVISNSKLLGRIKVGSDANANTTTNDWSQGERWARNITFRENVIGAVFRADGASLKLIDNEILWPDNQRFILNNSDVEVRNLRSQGAKVLNPQHRFPIGKSMSASDVRLGN